jgi:hypothetical protein
MFGRHRHRVIIIIIGIKKSGLWCIIISNDIIRYYR